MEKGIVPGGSVGVAWRVEVLDGLTFGGDQQIGVNIVKRAIEAMAGSRPTPGHEGIVVQKVREMKDDEGFNALTDTYGSLSRRASSIRPRS